MGDYRVKFVDIRVHPPGGRRRPGAQRVRTCEHKGCDADGDCKAPKPFAARSIPVPGQPAPADEHYWFCRRHAAEYNASYDFFDGMSEAEIAAFQASAHYGHKRTWRFGGGPVGGAKAGAAFNPNRWRGRNWIFEGYGARGSGGGEGGEEPARNLSRMQLRALEEMHLPTTATPEQVRQQYGLLIKRYHPDSNGGDRSMEHRLTVVIKAFKALKSTGLA
jgi:hypothetical protein